MDKAKLGKRKFNKSAYREGVWLLVGVDHETGQCFLAPCPDIKHWVLPGLIVYKNEWGAYSHLTAQCYTHDSANHSIQYVNPQTGVQINTHEGLWHHVKRQMTGCKNLEDLLIDFMFRKRFNASSGITQVANSFNVYLTVDNVGVNFGVRHL